MFHFYLFFFLLILIGIVVLASICLRIIVGFLFGLTGVAGRCFLVGDLGANHETVSDVDLF